MPGTPFSRVIAQAALVPAYMYEDAVFAPGAFCEIEVLANFFSTSCVCCFVG